jgi:heme-degrading monooxygenase HmoA
MALIEIAHFQLQAGVEDDAFLAAERGVRALITAQPGFLGRELARHTDGTWVVIMTWASAESAEGWSRTFMAAPEGRAFGSLLQMPSMRQEKLTRVEV